jgi:acetyl esterase/lipase
MTRAILSFRARAGAAAGVAAVLFAAVLSPAIATASPGESTPTSTATPAPATTTDPGDPGAREAVGTRPAVSPASVPTIVATNPDATYEYVSGLELDYYATAALDAPWIVFVHGGSWIEGDRTTVSTLPAWFQSAGFAVFSVDYRLAGQAVWPAQRDDVSSAVTWVRDNAAMLGVDPDRGALVGVSAGGHLALSASVAGLDIRGVVALSPSLSPYGAWKAAHTSGTVQSYKLSDGAVLLVGCSPYIYQGECWHTWYDATPRNFISDGDAPMLILQAKDDATVPASTVSGFCSNAKSVHVSCTVSMYSGTAHGLSLFKTTYAKVIAWVTAKTA